MVGIPGPGQYLVFQEYRDGHGGGTYPVVDIVTFDGEEEPEDRGDHLEVGGSCDSAGYDSLVVLEVWPSGEAYLAGDGINHPRYRVVRLELCDVGEELGDSGELTDMRGNPVYWDLPEFDQDSRKPQDSPFLVEYGLRLLEPREWVFRWALAKDGGDLARLVSLAREEVRKPKYCGFEVAIRVGGVLQEEWHA